MTKHLKPVLTAAILFASVSASGQNVASDSTVVLGLEQCIEIAMNENPTVKIADLEIKRVDYSRKEVIGQLLPSIQFAGSYSRTLAKQVTYFDMDLGAMGGGGTGEGGTGEGGTDGGDTGGEEPGAGTAKSGSKSNDGFKMGRDNAFQVGFSASMPLIAPQLWKTLSLSDAEIMQNVEKARASRINLVNQIETAYYSVLLAKDSYNLINENYERAKLNLKVYEGRYAVGTASEYDVLRSSVQVKNIEPELLQAEIAVKQAMLQLKVLMNVDVRTEISLATTLSDYEDSMYDHTLSIDRNVGNNTDLRSLDLQTNYLRKALTVQKMSWFPTLALSANYNWMSLSNGSPFKNFRWNPTSTVALSLTIPIFQGGQRYNRIKQAEVAVAEMGFQRENLERSLNMQVDIQLDNIQKNVKQIATNASGVEQAQKAYDIMHRSFEIGAATYLDLRDAELALTQSKLAYYQAIYNYLVADSNLKHLLGSADVEQYSKSNE